MPSGDKYEVERAITSYAQLIDELKETLTDNRLDLAEKRSEAVMHLYSAIVNAWGLAEDKRRELHGLLGNCGCFVD